MTGKGYLAGLALLVTTTAAAAEQAQVIHGDTLKVDGERIRLIGIDAPEGDQICQRDGRPWNCGDDATAALSELLTGTDVSCDVLGHDHPGRGLTVCFVGGLELNRAMVRQGWALAYYPARGAIPGPRYDAGQLQAMQAERGLWAGNFVPPGEWRAR